MLHYSIYLVKAKLSEYAGLASVGCEILLTRYGKPFAKLCPVTDEDRAAFELEQQHHKQRLADLCASSAKPTNYLMREEIAARRQREEEKEQEQL